MSNASKVKLIVLAAIATVMVVVPTTASAHPSVFTDTAKTVPTGWTYPDALDTQTRYVVNNHGYPYVLRESNGKTSGGVMNYQKIPGAYRTALKNDLGVGAVLTAGDTGAQSHATCTAAELNTVSAITGWQGVDPFFNYVPFQGTAVGIDDVAGDWIDDVLTLTGVNLANITDATYAEDGPLDAACEALGGGADLVPPDATQTAVAAFPSATLAAVVAPLNTQITTLTDEKTALEGQVTTLGGEKTTLEGQVATLGSEKQTLTNTVATMTGAKGALEGDNAKLKSALAKSKAAAKKAQRQIRSLKKQVAKLKKKKKS